MPDATNTVIDYHEKTKHSFDAFAPGPDGLDWATKPNPFRRYDGAPLISLDKVEVAGEPAYDDAFLPGGISPAPLNRRSISQLFFDSLAISAWKSAGGETWELRVDPSSGNLHPTEGYLLCGPVDGLCDRPMVCHYAPKEHALEVRAELPADTWQKLAAELPPHAVLLGITSIHWREAWKYGARAYRYCQHDVGHVLGALTMAAAGLGWQARLLNGMSSEQLTALLGTSDPQGVEPEEADCPVAVFPQNESLAVQGLPSDAIAECADASWHGCPNRISASTVDWPLITTVARAAHKPEPDGPYEPYKNTGTPPDVEAFDVSLRQVIRQRRSAQSMDGRTHLARSVFYRMLLRTLPRFGQFPFTTLPWPPNVHLALLVHRVTDLAPGLYFLLRDPREKTRLWESMRSEFAWRKPEGCPKELELYLLQAGDTRRTAMMISCTQDIASDGCFSLAMVSRFADPLKRYGPWFYPRLFWECGTIGQVLYLEAEAAGMRGTGIGCFFDNAMHEVLGLEGNAYQDLYHFTIGGPITDTRITTLPAYGE